MRRSRLVLLPFLALTVLPGCKAERAAAPPSSPAPISIPTPSLEAALASSFRARGQAGLDRLEQTAQQRACSEARGAALDPEVAERLRAEAQARLKFPADGQFLGDWRRGEAIAQSGRGLQFSDPPDTVNGGNCYACHQLSADEISYGTLGPSLLGYGKIRGQSQPMLEYTWTRIWNTHVYNPCASMPRFGDAGILSEQQIKDVMALLFDPESPVNR